MKNDYTNSRSIYSISENKYDNIGKIIYLGALMLVNTSFGIASTSIMPAIATQAGYASLGQISVLVIFGAGLIGNMFGKPIFRYFNKAPIFMKRISYRWYFFITLGCIITSDGNVIVKYILLPSIVTLCYEHHCSPWQIYVPTLLTATLSGLLFGGLFVG
jgi:hypothetical protein